MKYCNNCGKQLNDNDRFCTGCGRPVEQNEFENKRKRKKPFIPWLIGGVVLLLIIILVISISFGSCSAPPSADINTDQSAAQEKTEKSATEQKDKLYLADMIGKPLGFIEDYYKNDYEKKEYDDFTDIGPGLYCSGSREDDLLTIFAAEEYPADKDRICKVIMTCNKDTPVTKDLTSRMTYDEISKVVGTIPKPMMSEFDGYYITFEHNGITFSYFWGFENNGTEYDENDASIAHNPKKEKSEGVYIYNSDDSDYLDVLKDYALNEAYHEWVADSMSQDEYIKSTNGVIYYIGEEKVPVLILRCDAAYHAQNYTHAYKYVDGKVTEISQGDAVAYLNLDTGLMEFTYTGGGYGETNSFYYHVDNDYTNNKPVSSSAEFREYEDEMGMGNHYWLGEMEYDDNGNSKNEISKAEFDNLMKPYKKGNNVIDDFYGKMESDMEPISKWK